MRKSVLFKINVQVNLALKFYSLQSYLIISIKSYKNIDVAHLYIFKYRCAIIYVSYFSVSIFLTKYKFF